MRKKKNKVLKYPLKSPLSISRKKSMKIKKIILKIKSKTLNNHQKSNVNISKKTSNSVRTKDTLKICAINILINDILYFYVIFNKLNYFKNFHVTQT